MAQTHWYYAIGRQQHGPVSFEQLRALVASRSVRREHLVWQEGTSDWREAGSVTELFGSPQPPAHVEPTSRPRAQQSAPPRAYGPRAHGGCGGGGWTCAIGVDRGAARRWRRARTALILAILGIAIAPAHFVLGVIAIVFAGTALAEMRQSHDRRGHAMAVAALVLGIIAIVGRRLPISPWW
jgi:hypothetical protein